MRDVEDGRAKQAVTCVIVSHNSRDELSACLGRLLGSNAGAQMRVFVVDNASDDGTQAMVQSNFPSVELVENVENVFFTRANNQVLKGVQTEYVLILNPDSMVEPDTVAKMVAFMEAHPEAGASSCLFVDRQGRVIQTCWEFRTLAWVIASREPMRRLLGGTRTLRAAQMADWDRLSVKEVDVISDAFAIVRTSALRQVGFYDESFLLYFTEDDLCRRLKQAGFTVFHNSEASICHLVSHSTLKKPILRILKIHRNDLVSYFRKHHGRGAAAIAALATALELVVWWLFLGVSRRRPRLREVSS